MYADVFASRLKKAREYSGITQNEASKTLKIAQNTYSSYETGRREPSLDMLAMLSKLFDVKSDWLIGLTSDSGLDSISDIIAERERERVLKQMEKEAALDRRVWG